MQPHLRSAGSRYESLLGLGYDRGRFASAASGAPSSITPRVDRLDHAHHGLRRHHSIVVFRIGGETGLLERTGRSVEVLTPVCIQFLPGSK